MTKKITEAMPHVLLDKAPIFSVRTRLTELNDLFVRSERRKFPATTPVHRTIQKLLL